MMNSSLTAEQKALQRSMRAFLREDGAVLKRGEARETTIQSSAIAIDYRKQAEIQLHGEKLLLEMAASGNALPDVLTELCHSVEETFTDCRCSVCLLGSSGSRSRRVAAPSLPASFDDRIYGLVVRSEDGPCAEAVRLKKQVLVVDVESDPMWQASTFRPQALANGFRSCWSTPIYSSAGLVLGTLAILQRKPASPSPLQQELIARFTHIASIAIERAQGQFALRRTEAFLAEAQRLSSAGSFSWRVSTDEITWSEQLYRIFELDQDVPVTFQLIGSRAHPEDVPMFNDMIERARGTGSDFEYEHRLVMHDHSIKYLHLVAHAARDQDGQLEYIGAVQDVTQRRLSEEALDKARSELAHVSRVMSLGALTASIAHEVNQPLSGIITNAGTCLRMLAADPPDIEGARETARRTLRDGNRACDVIARLHALFSRKDAVMDLVDLNEAVREVIALSLSELQRARVILQPELADDLPQVTGDLVQLQQVILNLLLNAADAMNGLEDRPRQLVIRTARDEGDQVRLSVKDAGVGLEPRNMHKLFEPFYTTKNSGMGIGLYVSRSIIESHRGRLWAEPNEGPGATFSFSIPRIAGDVTNAHSPGATRTRAMTRAVNVT
jgi:signal transduction histidine kinase